MCVCVFSHVHVHMFVREEERARGHERQRSEKRERENPTNKGRDVSPPPLPACCGLPMARHLPHYSLHFTACCPLSAAILFVHTVAEAGRNSCTATMSEHRASGGLEEVFCFEKPALKSDIAGKRQ